MFAVYQERIYIANSTIFRSPYFTVESHDGGKGVNAVIVVINANVARSALKNRNSLLGYVLPVCTPV